EPGSASENPPETESQSDGGDGVHNRPNPFRAGKEETLIEYDLEQPSNVTITIYDLLGHQVWQENYRSGENGGAGTNSVPWDGRNLSGKVVANGGYICRIWVEKEKRDMLRKIAVAK
nr:T9SS type A sorting domain-containing protein [bacterium]NIO18578.1 T9SS type A sorting domain-containing protein [bacterium]NIO73589.1 T9SS type A sorting domain-containing protein [bacterium]